MSMIGEYLRLSPDELARALEDPAWALELADEHLDGPAAESLDVARHFSTSQKWDVLRFLLRRAAFDVDVIQGEESFTDDDWGYGPPRYLTSDRVRIAAERLSRLSYDDLIREVDPSELRAQEVYPASTWTEPDALEWARADFDALTQYFAAAATQGDAMLLWLD